MNLRESARQWVLTNLPYDRGDATLVGHLNGLDAHGLLIVYYNWMSRHVRPERRAVHKSAAFLRNPLTTQRANELRQIIDDIEKGSDLRKYLSRGVSAAAAVPGTRLGKRRDLDLMLNTQGIHHLHISTQVEADGFVKRDGPLLFAIFKPKAAYLIDIMGHGDWTRDHVLNVLANEWPNQGLVHELKGGNGIQIKGLRHNYTEDERAKLQKAGINTLVDLGGGRIVMPSGGITTAGTAMNATRETDRLLIWLENLEAHPDRVKKDFEAHGVSFPDEPEFEFAIDVGGPGVFERKTGTMINI